MCENKYNFLSSLQLQCVHDSDVSDVECLREAKRSTSIISGLNQEEEMKIREEAKQVLSQFRLKRRKKNMLKVPEGKKFLQKNLRNITRYSCFYVSNLKTFSCLVIGNNLSL